jgi:NAD(P)-dependent dehydrogenase (short-subunit alcohol dehydrogenase family)
MPLHGKVLVVTGAGRGIGAAIVAAAQAAGATVIGLSRSQGCDVSREADVARWLGGRPRVDVLVNNAAILTPRKPLVEVTVTEWDETMAVNLRGVFLCVRAVLPAMLAQREGLIINFSSGVGRRGAAGWGPYAVSKWGVEGLTKCLAAELVGTGVRVVAFNPGGTRTAMRAAAYPQEDPQRLNAPAAVAEYVLKLVEGQVPFDSGESLDYPG